MNRSTARGMRTVRRLLAAALITTLFLPGSAGAQEADDAPSAAGEPNDLEQPNSAFAVSPGTNGQRPDRSAISLEVLPGQTIQDSISIFNFTDEPISFRVWSGDGYNTADGGFAIYGEDVDAVDTGSWIELPDTEVTVGPASRADLPILIRVPENAEPGDHAGGVAGVNTTPVETVDAGDANIDLLRAVGARVYLRVAGPLNPALEVRNIEVDGSQPLLPGLTGSGSARLTFEIVNTGNLRVAPTAATELSGPFGIGKQTNDPIELRELLPGSSVQISQEFTEVPALGRMTARIHLTTDAVDTVRTTTFWAVPWLYVAVVILLGGWWWWRRRRSGDDDPGHRAWPDEEPTDHELVSV